VPAPLGRDGGATHLAFGRRTRQPPGRSRGFLPHGRAGGKVPSALAPAPRVEPPGELGTEVAAPDRTLPAARSSPSTPSVRAPGRPARSWISLGVICHAPPGAASQVRASPRVGACPGLRPGGAVPGACHRRSDGRAAVGSMALALCGATPPDAARGEGAPRLASPGRGARRASRTCRRPSVRPPSGSATVGGCPTDAGWRSWPWGWGGPVRAAAAAYSHRGTPPSPSFWWPRGLARYARGSASSRRLIG
jgi:hypothetical protein